MLCSSNYAKYCRNSLVSSLNDHLGLLESAACYWGVLIDLLAAKFSDDEERSTVTSYMQQSAFVVFYFQSCIVLLAMTATRYPCSLCMVILMIYAVMLYCHLLCCGYRTVVRGVYMISNVYI